MYTFLYKTVVILLAKKINTFWSESINSIRDISKMWAQKSDKINRDFELFEVGMYNFL